MTTSSIMLTGRWLHYGIEHHEAGLAQGVWSAHAWDAACKQAKDWGLTGVHPKVAEGGYRWYDDNGLTMLHDTAIRHGLLIAPYHYVYGNKFGALQHEAEIAAWIGKRFGIVIPDMESEWEGHPDWMQQFGFMIEHNYGYTGPIVPTTFANPVQHASFPYIQMLTFAAAWLPQVYFDLWTFNGHKATAQDGVNYVYPQWRDLDAKCQQNHIPTRPILPLIGLSNGVPQQEIANWLNRMQGYGYCGFWYDGVYSAYADTVSHAPVPGLKVEPPPVQPPTEDFVKLAWGSEWQALVPGVALDSEIAKADYKDYQKSIFHGPVTKDAVDFKNWHGTPGKRMLVAGGRYEEVDGAVHYYPYV